ncbi:uncharacterized protein BDCG_17830, partial [Blastomyces dermatitidis ER-3]
SLHEICFYQKLRNLIFLKIIFAHLVCEINEENHQFQCSVLNIIQVAAEFTLIYTDYLLNNIKIMTYHSYVILTVRDTQLMINIMKTLRIILSIEFSINEHYIMIL